MKYFLMKPDERLHHAVRITLTEQQMENSHAQVIAADLNPDKDLPDFIPVQKLTKKVFLVSDLCKNMLEVYADAMRAEPCILADLNRGIQKNYWKVQLEEIDCLHREEKKMFQKKDFVIDEGRTMEKFIFSVRMEDVQYWVATLPFAENFLRKNMFGVEWIPLQTVNEGEETVNE